MKKYKFGAILIKLLIVILLIFTILFIMEKIYSCSNEVKWKKYDSTIYSMNVDKLANNDWNGYDLIWRYKDETLPSKSHKKRILIVGDSYVWGNGYVNSNHIWWQQLRNRLLENGYNDVEIIAMGRDGYNTKQQHETLIKNDIMKTIMPDLIIFTYVQNDTEAWQTPYDDNPVWIETKANSSNILQLLFSNSTNVFLSDKFPNLYDKVNGLLLNKYSNYIEGSVMSYSDYSEKIFSSLFLEKYDKEVLKPLKIYLEKDIKIPYFFVSIPYYPSIQLDKVKFIFESNNINFIEFNNNYINEINYNDKNVANINPANGHAGPAVTDFMSRKVLEYLEENYSNVLGSKSKVQMNEIIINDPMPRSINLNQVDDNVFKFTYPSKKEKNAFLNMPIEKDYIKLNFMYPVDLKTIEITGENVKDIDVYINKINSKLGYDDQKMYKLESKDKYIWDVNSAKVTSINISANIKNGKSSNLTIKFIRSNL